MMNFQKLRSSETPQTRMTHFFQTAEDHYGDDRLVIMQISSCQRLICDFPPVSKLSSVVQKRSKILLAIFH